MKLFGLQYFNFAGANDFVTFTRGGVEVDSGNGLAGLLRPSTTVSVVQLGVRAVSFRVAERSKDGQIISVSGELVVEYAKEMRDKFDFSVYRDNGKYRNDPTSQIEDQVRIAVRQPLRSKLAEMDLDALAKDGVKILNDTLAAAVAKADSDLMKLLGQNKISVQQASVKQALPEDSEVAEAFGAKEREELLASQDKAIADRRKAAAESDRDIRTYEEETAKELVEKQAERIEAEGQNAIKRAEAAAQAEEKRLAVYAGKSAEELLSLSLLAAAENGIDSLSIDPALLSAVRSAAKG